MYVQTLGERRNIYRLVDQMAQVPESKKKKKVWIDSQTEDEILRGFVKQSLYRIMIIYLYCLPTG